MVTPEPYFFVVFVVPFSCDDGFRVEAVFTQEQDAIAHAEQLEQSKNYQFVTQPNKELMSSVLDRLLEQKLQCFSATGAKAITINISR